MTQTSAKLDKKAGLIPGQTIWYTKYALSDGKAQEVQLICTMPDYGDTTIKIGVNGFDQLAFANEWHTTKAAAEYQIMKMCANKRKSIQKQLDKIAAIEASIKGN